jgi:hypothetical protein
MKLTKSLAFASALALSAAPALATPTATAPVATHTVKSTTPVKAPVQDSGTDYAQREAQDKSVANYEGGSTVVIGISGGALLVLLFLLLII